MNKASRPASGRKRLFRRILIALAALSVIVLLAAVDAFIIEPRWVKVTRYDVRLPGLPKELDGFRLVQMSDIHRCDYVPDKVIRSAVNKSNKLHPDLVVLTGDFINQGPQHASPCAEILSKLRSRLGSYAVMGNHDYWNGEREVKAALKRHGIKVLINDHTEVAPGLVILGLDDYWTGHPDIEKAWKGVDESKAQILLSHSPLALGPVRDREKSCLMLSGHTHGGQVQIPPIPRESLPGLKGWKYIRGWYLEGRTLMYVNSGIGMIRPPARFLCRPEVTLFTLRSGRSGIEVE